jgi:hypothetical protein
MQECSMVFCNVEHHTCDVGGQCFMCHNPSPQGAFKTSTHPSKGNVHGH